MLGLDTTAPDTCATWFFHPAPFRGCSASTLAALLAG
jgi:hypothetical protein